MDLLTWISFIPRYPYHHYSFCLACARAFSMRAISQRPARLPHIHHPSVLVSAPHGPVATNTRFANRKVSNIFRNKSEEPEKVEGERGEAYDMLLHMGASREVVLTRQIYFRLYL